MGTALQRIEKQLAGRQVVTELPESLPLVYVDDVLCGQLVVNLLENAVKYTPAGTAIEVTAEADHDAVTLEVRDRGAGFAEGEEQRVFEKFYRGKSEGVRGAGLGLADLPRDCDRSARGTIAKALNRSGGGAILRVRLPLENVR